VEELLVAGDTFHRSRQRFRVPAGPGEQGVPAGEILAMLQHLRDLPVELVLPTHGKPADRAALERALA
jgi:glyoxylase-like metal-dependent hydrolase (beta-lactamase superfamily II)